eukprot:jgi/Galph1/2591/GphlegSOOS_G1262.1
MNNSLFTLVDNEQVEKVKEEQLRIKGTLSTSAERIEKCTQRLLHIYQDTISDLQRATRKSRQIKEDLEYIGRQLEQLREKELSFRKQ